METVVNVLYVFMGIIISIFVAMGIFYTVIYFVRKSETEKELKDIIRMCREIEDKRTQKGIAAFNPPPGEAGYYEVLVDRGVMKKNPLGGYSFTDSHKKTWGGISESFSSAGDNYKDDDGIMQVFKYANEEVKITEEIVKGDDFDKMMASIAVDRFLKSLELWR